MRVMAGSVSDLPIFTLQDPRSVAAHLAGTAVPEVCLAPRGGFDLELAKTLLDVLVVPMMITPIVVPLVDSMVSPAAYRSLPFLSCWWTFQYWWQSFLLCMEVADNPVRECSPSFQASPVGSCSGPIPSPLSP